MSPPKQTATRERRTSILDVGGPNSINNFASSYSRVQSYMSHCLDDRRSIDLDDDLSPGTSPVQEYASIEGNEEELDSNAIFLNSPERSSDASGRGRHGHESLKSFQFPHNDLESSPLLQPRVRSGSQSSSRFAGITGGSTAPQTIFNSINTLMGIGMLSLPFGFKLTGWVLGTFILASCAITTNYTAKILGRVLKRHHALGSYGDIAQEAYGSIANVLVSSVFTADLVGATASLVILFGDSFGILIPSVSPAIFKTIMMSTVFISSFLPLSALSMFSLLGIICTSGVVAIILYCGLTVSGSGSLLNPAPTELWPSNPYHVLLALGIFMAPWGGHVVFPELYRDMRHPKKFDTCANVTFNATFFMDYVIAAVGFVMFGSKCKDSFTKNLMLEPNFPNWVPTVICLLLGILAMVKAPLLIRPVLSVLERLVSTGNSHTTKNNLSIKKVLIRFLYCGFLLFISLVVTSFGGIMAFLGSAICFTICVILPLMFSLTLFRDEHSILQRVLLRTGIVIGIICAVGGTYAAITVDTDF
ncbi:vacuolar amino acid transporter 1 [[Candida] anglica]|uniref:Vacuolar amino acid transporter 1 n=1 Tax=[Candida] anglica TaxID=148631 RepID=A0ABP0EBR8_9ASCO